MKTKNGPTADNARAHLFLSGTVQGVGMRAYVHRVASSLSLSGWVRNLPDERVELVLEGPRKRVEHALDEIKNGHFSRYLAEIETAWEPATGDLKGFEIQW